MPTIIPGAPISTADAQRLGAFIYITPEEYASINNGTIPDSFKTRVATAQQQLSVRFLTEHPEGAPALDTSTPDSELAGKASALASAWITNHVDFGQQYMIEGNAVKNRLRVLDTEIAQAKSVQEQQSREVMKFDKLGQKEAMQQAGIAAGNAKKAAETALAQKERLASDWAQRMALWNRCIASDYPVGPDGLFDPEASCAAVLQAAAAPQAAAKTYLDAEGNEVAVGSTMESTDKKCPGCGATTVFDATDTAACCPYCGSTQVMPVDDQADAMAPGGVVPFEISQQKASQLFKSWIKGKFFAPNAAKKSCEAKNFSGVYLPFWTYDSQTTSPYQVELGYRHERTNSKGETETYYEYKHFSGIYEKFVDDEVVYGSKRTDNPFINSVKNFDFKKIRPYSPEFIAGFLAERYTVGLDDGWQLAKNQIKNTLRGEIGQYEKQRQHADTVDSVNFNTDFSKVTFKYVLAPIWIANYRFNNEVYNFVVNGQTGKIAGKSPISIPKVILAIVLAIIAIIVIYNLCCN